MTPLETLQNWVQTLSRNLNCELHFNGQHAWSVQYGDDLLVHVLVAPDNPAAFVVAGPVLGLTQDPAVDALLLTRALHLNFLGQQTQGGTLALNTLHGTLVLAHTLRFADCDALALQHALENVAESIAHVRALLLADETGAPVPAHFVAV